MTKEKLIWAFLRIFSSIVGAMAGAFVTANVVDYAEVSIFFGDKSNVFLAASVGVPVGSSIGYTLWYWKRWRITGQISMVGVCSAACFLFSYAFLLVGLTISERYVLILFILQFVCVIAITAIVGMLMNKSSLTSGSRRA
jgi:hypothetical protein